MQKNCYAVIKPAGCKLLKYLLMTKLALIISFICSFQAFAINSLSQEKINLDLKDVPFETVFKKIESQGKYRFVYKNEILPQSKLISVYAKNATLDYVMEKVLSNTELTYRVMDKNLVVLLNTAVETAVLPISGTIMDNDGKPLAGVSILQKGTSNGTTSNEDGSFTLNIPNAGAVLVFTHTGYMLTEQAVLGGQTNLVVVLQKEESNLDEVVVIGYGTQKKKDLTGAIGSVGVENSPAALLPNANVLDAIKGRIAGFDIGAVTNAGGNPSISIRGQNSIRASNTPLVVVDGVIFVGSFNEINPNDIATVDVLKDASARAIYGSRSANGVVLITTKRGKSGKPVINLRASTGFQTYTRKPDMRNGAEFIQFRYDVKKLNGASASDLEIDRLLTGKELEAYKAGHEVNWWNQVVKPAPFRDYQVNFSGGNDRYNFYVSGNYLDQKGIVYNDNFKKFTVLSKVEAKITDWMKYGLTLSMANKNADGVSADLEKGTINAPYSYVYSTFPGYENWFERYPQSSTTTFSPFWRTLTYDEDRNQNYRSLNNLRIDVPFIKGLSYTFNYALNRWEGHASQFNNEKTFVNTLSESDLISQTKYLVNANGNRNSVERTDWYLNHLVNYSRTFLENHSVDVTLLAERQMEKNRRMTLSATDFSQAGTTVLGVNSLELGDPTKRGVSTDDSKLTQLAYMARLNYVFKNRYHLSTSIRKDGYSGFADGNKFGVFRSLALAYTLSNEPFFTNKYVNYLKIRASFGENGNPSIGAYNTFPGVSTSNYLFGTTPVNTIYVNRLANKALKWESTAAFNLGFDFGIWGDVATGSINYYNSNTHNLLLSRAIPIINGFTSVNDNIGKVNNKGIEIQLTTKNINRKNFYWTSDFNFWMNRNKIVSLYGLDGNKDGKEDDDIANNLFIGKSLGAVYSIVFDGIVQQADTAYQRIYVAKPGDIKFKDLDGNGKINSLDRTIIGYTKPNYTFSLANTIGYKNLELYFMFATIQGGGKDNWYLASNQYANNPNTLFATVANWLDKEYWMPEHPSNTIPSPNYVNQYGYGFYQRHDFIRLQDLMLSYQLNQNLLRRTPVKNLKAYVSGKNLLTFTNWDGLDPETSTTYGAVNGFPVFKIVTLGLSVTF